MSLMSQAFRPIGSNKVDPLLVASPRTLTASPPTVTGAAAVTGA